MILPNEKLIYIHVPKTGGASVEDYLLDNFNQERSVLSLTGGIGLLKIKNRARIVMTTTNNKKRNMASIDSVVIPLLR